MKKTRLLATLVLVVLANFCFASNILNSFKSWYTMPSSICGIVMKEASIEGNELHYNCYVNIDSPTIIGYLRLSRDSITVEKWRADVKKVYSEHGAKKINLDAINPYNFDIYDKECPIYRFFKAQVISDLTNCVSIQKLPYNSNYVVKFCIYISETSIKNPDALISTISFFPKDFAESCNVEKHGGDVFMALRLKYEMIHGIELNQKTLPIPFENGAVLESIDINDNEFVYNATVKKEQNEDMPIGQFAVDMGRIIEGIKSVRNKTDFSNFKGFPLLGVKITYKWYVEGENTPCRYFTLAYPSLQVVDVYPTNSPTLSLIHDEFGYTDNDSTKCFPIFRKSCLVDMGTDCGLWENYNMGAKSPEEIGGYYAWGDTTGVNHSLNIEDYHIEDTISCIKGNVKYDYSMKSYDFIPTVKDWEELFSKNLRIYTSYNKVPGYLFVSYLGNSIFLPLCGYRHGENVHTQEPLCQYWTADRDPKEKRQAISVLIDKISMNIPNPIWRGLPIRAIANE